AAADFEARSIPLGRPIANTRVYVLDERSNPLPAGMTGELAIGGDGLARGYLGDPALTAQRFVPDSCSGEAGARLYRTGDLARWSSAGAIEFLGRSDSQLKIRGFRVEAGEVEAALMRCASVREAVVAKSEETLSDGRLAAYVVPREPPAPGIAPD